MSGFKSGRTIMVPDVTFVTDTTIKIEAVTITP